MMRTFAFIFLLTFPFFAQRLVADDIADIVARNGVVGKEPAKPAPQTWTSVRITNVLQKITESWEQSPRTAYGMIVHQNIQIGAAESDSLKMLFKGISDLPVPLAQADAEAMQEPLFLKERMLFYLIYNTPLHNDPDAWTNVAVFVGWVRPQIIPNYQRHGRGLNGVTLGETEEVRNTRIRENGRKIAMDNCQQKMANIVEHWSSPLPIRCIRTLASKMPPDERKRYLDKIKELARSDEEEAKRLDAPYEEEN